jgi:hypothetical protein
MMSLSLQNNRVVGIGTFVLRNAVMTEYSRSTA